MKLAIMMETTVATYPSTGGQGEIEKGVFSWRKRAGVATNVYSRKTLEKPKRGLQILKIRVLELFMHREGISTPHAPSQRTTIFNRVCNKNNVTSKLFISQERWNFLFFFSNRQGCCPCSYVSPGAMRKSDLRSSSGKNVCVLNWFFLFDFVILHGHFITIFHY